MKTKLKKAACLFLSTLFVTLLPISTYGHNSHVGDESCRYSCILQSENNCEDLIAARQKNRAFIEAYRNVKTDAELEILIADHFGIDRSEFDLAGLRNAVETFRAEHDY